MEALTQRNVILLADDDPDDHLIVSDALSDALDDKGLTHELYCVEDGQELMDYLRRQGAYAEPGSSPRPALILLDLNMPRKKGLEAIKEIKSEPLLCSIPLVVLSTSEAEADIAVAYSLGADSFITKPVRFDTLVDIVKELARRWLKDNSNTKN